MKFPNWSPLLILVLIGISFSLIPQPKANTTTSPFLPQPTQLAPHTEEEDDHQEEQKRREEWMENMHKAAPGVDWQAIDEQTRLEQYRKFSSSSRATRKVQQTDTLANGNLIGEWFEKGSVNQAGRMILAKLDTATNQLYAASAGGNIWKSDPNGNSWQSLHDEIRIKGIRFLERLPQNGGPTKMLVAGNKYFLSTIDDCVSWDTASGLDNVRSWGDIQEVVMAGDSLQSIYLLTNEWDYGPAWAAQTCLFRSTDQGQSFSNLACFPKAQFKNHNHFAIWTSPWQDGSAYLLHDSTCMQITAAGQLDTLGILPGAPEGRTRLCGSRDSSQNVLYAFSDKDIYRSGDGGMSWTFQGNAGTNDFSRPSFSASLTNPNLVFIGGVNAYRSTDGGVNWNDINDWTEYYNNVSGKLHADIPAIQSWLDTQGNEHQYICTDGGLYRSDNYGVTVLNLSLNQLNVSQYYTIYSHRNNPDIIYAGAQDQGFQRTTTGGSSPAAFSQIISGDYAHIVSGNGGSSIWMVYPGFAHYYANATSGFATARYDFNGTENHWLPPLLADPDFGSVCYMAGGNVNGSGSHILRLEAIGGTVNVTENAYDFESASSGGELSALALSKQNPDFRYAMTDNGTFFHSSDAGITWQKTLSFTGPEPQYLYGSAILPDPVNLGTIYIGGSGYSNPPVYKSTDHGATFTALNNGLPPTLVYELESNADGSLVFAATEVGPYVLVVSENQWYPMAADIAPDQTYWTVDYTSINNTVRFGTYGRGIWEFQIQSPVVTSLEASVEQNREWKIWPHPARDVLNMNRVWKEDFTVQIFDLQGRKLDEVFIQAGNDDLKLDVSAFPRGNFVLKSFGAKKSEGLSRILILQ